MKMSENTQESPIKLGDQVQKEQEREKANFGDGKNNHVSITSEKLRKDLEKIGSLNPIKPLV